MIDYSRYSESTRADFEYLVRHYARLFLEWKAGSVARSQQEIEPAFRAWWFCHGPLSFKRQSDLSRFRVELLAEITNPTTPPADA